MILKDEVHKRSISIRQAAREIGIAHTSLILFAAGLVSLAAHELNEAGWIPALIDPVWDLSSILSEESTRGGILKALFGYQSSLSLAAVLGYLLYLFTLGTKVLFPQKSLKN